MNVFPITTNMEFNTKKSEVWDSVIVKKTGSGRRKSLSRRAYPDWKINVKFTGLTAAQRDAIAGFIGQQHGEHVEFLWLDSEDYQETDVRIGTGNGSNKQFQLLRNLADKFVFPVVDIVPDSWTVYVDGTAAWVLSINDGLVTLRDTPGAGAVITATFRYYWRVTFDQDEFTWTDPFYDLYKFDTLKLVTV